MPLNWFERNPKKTLGIFWAILGCLMLLLGEIGGRLFFPQWMPGNADRNFWIYDSVLGWRHKPHQHGRFTHRDFSIEIQINSDGLRDKEYSKKRTPHKRMLVLGDSYGWGFGVEQADIFSEVLERQHADWEIINASVSGYGTDQQLLYLQRQGIQYQPDVLLLLLCENDFLTNTLYETAWYNKPIFISEGNRLQLKNVPVPQSTITQRLDRFFYGKTFLWVRIYREISRFFNVVTFLLNVQQEKHREIIGEHWEEENAITFRLLAELHHFCQAHRMRFFIVSIPMNPKRVALLADFSQQERIPYLSLDERFGRETAQTIFAHDGHWNQKGHQIAAEAIDQFFQEYSIFNPLNAVLP